MSNLRHRYTHEVESGDTFYQISEKFGINMDELMSANPHIEDINIINPGDKINIPSSFNGFNEIGRDYDNDGYIDTNYVDLNNDGIADLMTLDNNADNIVDNIYTLNSTSPINQMKIDYDDDGYVDNNIMDFNNDGIADTAAPAAPAAPASLSDYHNNDGYVDDVSSM